MHVLRHLGLEPDIRAIGVSPAAYVVLLHATGEVIQRFSLSEEHESMHGAPYTQLHRADLHDLLAARARAFDPNVVRLNHRATGFTESADGVELRFADGTSARGDLLIAADGLKSVVRAQMFGAAPATYTGDAAHPTLPYLAQGAAMAIEDGAVLTRTLGMTDSVAEALQIYQRNRVDRTAKIVLQSSANRELFHLRSEAEIRARFSQKHEGEDRNRWLYSYNPLTVELK